LAFTDYSLGHIRVFNGIACICIDELVTGSQKFQIWVLYLQYCGALPGYIQKIDPICGYGELQCSGGDPIPEFGGVWSTSRDSVPDQIAELTDIFSSNEKVRDSYARSLSTFPQGRAAIYR
jgi:hypothetical protein